MKRLKEMLARRQPGFSLERDFYHDQAVLDMEIKAIFEREWVFAGNSSEIPNAGDYITATVGRNSVILSRKQDGNIGAYLNSCRHRGSLVCLKKKGHAYKLVCPYHQWTYDLDGKLLHAGEMPASFDASNYSLKTVSLENMAGMLYVCVNKKPT